MRKLLILALLAGTAFVAGCQSSPATGPGVQRMSIYGQPCNTRIREAGLCRSATYR